MLRSKKAAFTTSNKGIETLFRDSRRSVDPAAAVLGVPSYIQPVPGKWEWEQEQSRYDVVGKWEQCFHAWRKAHCLLLVVN